MKKGLQKSFPMIRTRKEVLDEIRKKPELSDEFNRWTDERQETFLDFCTGVRGVKLLYDSFFKEIINPENTPERMEALISLILGQTVKICKVLPGDSSRIADETSLLIMDILVELEDGSLANVEVQKIGYSFPGARCACYSADLLLREYKRVRGEKGKKFSYRDIKGVFTIVLFESSPMEFHEFTEDYIHMAEHRFNTGLEMDLLQKYVFIPLDIFHKNLQNNGIRNDLDAWLTFLSVDDPVVIERLITEYPRFIPMYEDVYEMCRNTEKVMGLYSKELRMLDRNTVQLMIDEQQEQIDRQREQLDQQKEQLDQQKEQLNQKDEQLNQQKEQLNQKDQEIKELRRLLAKEK